VESGDGVGGVFSQPISTPQGDGAGFPRARRAGRHRGPRPASAIEQEGVGQVLDAPEGGLADLRTAVARWGNGDIYGLHPRRYRLLFSQLVTPPAAVEESTARTFAGREMAGCLLLRRIGSFESTRPTLSDIPAAARLCRCRTTPGGIQPLGGAQAARESSFPQQSRRLVSA